MSFLELLEILIPAIRSCWNRIWKRHITVTGENNKKQKCSNVTFASINSLGLGAVSHLAGGGVGVRACTVVPYSVRVVCKNSRIQTVIVWNLCVLVRIWSPKLQSKQRWIHLVSVFFEQLALFCYTSGVSFVCLEYPHFKEFCRLLNAGYLPPSRKALSTSLLNAENASINKWKDGLLSQKLYLPYKYRHSSRKSYQFWSFD